MRKLLLLVILGLAFNLNSWGQEQHTISGYVKDAGNGESLIGATVVLRELASGNITNVYGFYSITVPSGAYTVEYRYVGYQTISKAISLVENIRLDVELTSSEQQLQEIVITAEPEDDNVSGIEMSTAELDITTIEKIPAFLGEVDVIKSLQLLPGVSSVGEGSSGFNVRGGNVGQNLVLLDEAPVYNSSHLLGFFSVFNPDAVKDVKLYKGGIPSQYGGRISSILDIRMKEGNNKTFEANGGIGTIFSRLAIEGPIVKEKASFILAGRRSYADVLARPFTDFFDEGAALNFYDITAKANYNFSQNDRVYISGYFGRDNFKFDARQGFSWGNKTTTIRWNHLFNDRLFSNFTTYFSDYDYELAFGETDQDRFEWNSRIFTYDIKPEFSYFINTRNELTFGANALLYRFRPANALGISDGELRNFSLDEKKALESALYIGNEQKIGSNLTVKYGLRYSNFRYLGSGNAYSFSNPEAGMRKTVIDTMTFGNFETIQQYQNLEPRFSFNYRIAPTISLKGSYNRMAQYIHLISNTTASNPLDVWTPSTNNIKPQLADQVAMGYFQNFVNNKYEASVEFYYRKTQNQIDYIDGADLLINEFLEGDVLSGIGRAYGAEFSLRKNEGKINGWVSYTLGRTELQVEGINNGEWYPTRFDQLHNLKIAAFYDINERLSLSGNFTFVSGTPTTFPSSRFEIQGYTIPYNPSEKRNNFRIPNYHRLDLALIIDGKKFKKNGKKRKNDDELVVTIYNLYGRQNPFSIYFWQGAEIPEFGEPAQTKATQLSIIGTIFPSIAYNFKF